MAAPNLRRPLHHAHLPSAMTSSVRMYHVTLGVVTGGHAVGPAPSSLAVRLWTLREKLCLNRSILIHDTTFEQKHFYILLSNSKKSRFGFRFCFGRFSAQERVDGVLT